MGNNVSASQYPTRIDANMAAQPMNQEDSSMYRTLSMKHEVACSSITTSGLPIQAKSEGTNLVTTTMSQLSDVTMDPHTCMINSRNATQTNSSDTTNESTKEESTSKLRKLSSWGKQQHPHSEQQQQQLALSKCVGNMAPPLMSSSAVTTLTTTSSSLLDKVEGFVRVASKGVLGKHKGARIHLTLDGRHVSVIRGRNNELFCIDSICYHAGGNLYAGDIENLGNKQCIVCPWHKYKIDMKTGEGYYVDFNHRLVSKGKRQRTHEVKEMEDGSIMVRLNLSDPDKLPSDDYAYAAKLPGG